ncbi:hypothetical protein KL86DES1_10586 [uncultured Desulfovibrio sp.]|uniref:Uncharacterized protein n=1 Tax=uncultured Desulfovibrio sp. TaxID=167968 RepID=A0A212KZL3_9BACT|nr:hypothetical protein KL86DES1_10586 [uncultured Desulfovibrio sp.]VZH32462.1 conserved protein of unknown function [Desulfovibrio sp. 86]
MTSLRRRDACKKPSLPPPIQISKFLVIQYNRIKVSGGGGVGEETLLQKGPSPTKHCKIKLS